MKTTEFRRSLIAVIIAVTCWPFVGESQSTFQNLDFEAAHLAPIPSGQYGTYVPISDGLPYWRGFIGTNQVTQVLQNNYSLSYASLSIMGPNYSTPTNYILEGNFSVILQAGRDPLGSFAHVSASINQAGLVPADAKSLQFKLGKYTTALAVAFAGNDLRFYPLTTTGNYTLYGADITPYAGQFGLLQFAAPASPYPMENAYLDSITFSSQLIPEPSSLALFGLGLGLLVRWRDRRFMRQRP